MVVVDQPARPVGRSREQALEALKKANLVRSYRKVLKRKVAAGRRSAIPVLLAAPEWAETMQVLDLLMAVPKVGRVKANKALVRAGVPPFATLGRLTPRQRQELAQALGDRR